MRQRILQQCRRGLPRLLTIVIFIIAWQILVTVGNVSEMILPSPSRILTATIATWPDLASATVVTAMEGVLGFALAIIFGLLIGITLYCSQAIHDALYPLIAAAQTIPLITIAPLFIIWFGFEPIGKILIVTIFALFPIAVQTYRGLSQVPPFYEDVALTCGASRRWTLWHVKLRVAAEQIFSGLRISAAYVFTTAATAEYLGAQNGLGIWIQSAFNSFQTTLIFSATFVIVLLSAILLGLIALIEQTTISHTYSTQ